MHQLILSISSIIKIKVLILIIRNLLLIKLTIIMIHEFITTLIKILNCK